jgi:hypothetical protein
LGIRERYEAQKEASDRRAQERSPQPWWWLGQRDPIVRLTKWLVIWTALLFVGTVVSAAILWKTDHTARESFTAVQRAFVTVNEVKIEKFQVPVYGIITNPNYWRFTPTIENSGGTPTKNLRWATSVAVGGPTEDFNKLGLDGIEKDATGPAWRYGILGPKARINLTQDATRLELPEGWFPEMAANRKNVVWQGVFQYDDIFPDTEGHITKFCYVVRVPAVGEKIPFLQQCYGRKNCADEECKK